MFRNVEGRDWLLLLYFLALAAGGYAVEHFNLLNHVVREKPCWQCEYHYSNAYIGVRTVAHYFQPIMLAAVAVGVLAMLFPKGLIGRKWHVDPDTGERHRVKHRIAGQVIYETATFSHRFIGWAENHRSAQRILFWLPIVFWLYAPFLRISYEGQDWIHGWLGLFYFVGSLDLIMSPLWALFFLLGLYLWFCSLREREMLAPPVAISEPKPFGGSSPAAPLNEHLR